MYVVVPQAKSFLFFFAMHHTKVYRRIAQTWGKCEILHRGWTEPKREVEPSLHRFFFDYSAVLRPPPFSFHLKILNRNLNFFLFLQVAAEDRPSWHGLGSDLGRGRGGCLHRARLHLL